MKLAHFSDIHVTHFPLSGAWALKRLAAVASYTLMGRGKHFQGSAQRIERLLADVDAQGVQHAVCTGDLTGVSLEAEFAEVAALFGDRRHQPQCYTVIPGNHDCYVHGTEALFPKYFSQLSEGARFPFVKDIGGGVSLVAINVARPAQLIDSSGLCGAAQLRALKGILTDDSLKQRFVILLMHYGLLRSDGQRDRPRHGLRDDLELMGLIDQEDINLDLVLHGHMHRPYAIKTQRRLVINAGSATDTHVKDCGYNIYGIDAEAHRVSVTRRVWDSLSSSYVAQAHVPHTWTTREP